MSEIKDLANNPFAALFASVEQAAQFSSGLKQKVNEEVQLKDEEVKKKDETKHKLDVNWMIEHIFLITLDKEIYDYDDRPSRCVYMEDMYHTLDGQSWLEMENLEQAVFERLLLQNPGSQVVALSQKEDPTGASLAGESQVLRYLYQSYKRYRKLLMDLQGKTLVRELETCRKVIFMNGRICLQQPELYHLQSPHQQFISLYEEEMSIFHSSDDLAIDFFDELVHQIEENAQDGPLSQVFKPILQSISDHLTKELSLLNTGVIKSIDFLSFFTRKSGLAMVLLEFSSPKDWNNGKSFEQTLLGALFSLSCIPRTELGPYEFFENPSSRTKQDIDATESSIQQPLANMCERVYQLILAMIKLSSDLRHKILSWLGRCISANAGRTKIWSSQMPQLFTQMYASEGFCLNLCSIMLRLCKPFSEAKSDKLLKIQPTYCKVVPTDVNDSKVRGIHAVGLSKETCLIPSEENDLPESEESYNFITECFFLTQQCIHMSFHTVHEKFLKLNQELHRVQRLYNEVRGQGNDEVEPVRSIKRQMEKGMTLYLCMKAALTEPQLLEMSLNFHLASATWLSQIAVHEGFKTFQPMVFPLPEHVPKILSCIPEFLMGNLTDFTLFLQRFKDEMYETAGVKLEHLMTLILVYMGSAERMRNPHLRAELAETLASLLPLDSNRSSARGIVSWYSREQLFSTHPLIEHLSEKLLNVFVSIEMTGQSVEFEQKFNYRRPMYQVLEHIWEITLHRKCIRKLAVEAEDNIEATDPPLFLRFINLLINDAIFLLDEAFDYMTQIKDKQAEKDRGDWNNLEQQQRQENENTLRQITMLARYHNMMANDTIHSLEMITREIKTVFCHDSMVDRIAGMLNYFLLLLVGPKQRNFNVKDKNEIEFKPQQVVSDISQIYLNLGDSDTFCMAVSADGRSYSSELFEKAINVLQRIGKSPTMISEVGGLQDKIEKVSKQQKEEEELCADAPNEFLDPIMGTLMREPVLLPSSKNIVDKAVIARHILSDQTDPFNRSPLSLDMVEPCTELKERIETWIKQKKDSS